MNSALFIPLLLGTIGILQGAITKEMAPYIGLTISSLITSICLLLCCLTFYTLIKMEVLTNIPEAFLIQKLNMTFKWWFLLPGIFAFLITILFPLSLLSLDAVKVTIGIIAAQVITSVVLDYITLGALPNFSKLLGICFAALSIFFITKG